MSEGLMRHAPRLLVWAGLLCLIGLGIALASQHGGGVRPCPWCVLQRGIVLLIAACALLGGGLAWALKHAGRAGAAHWTARLSAIPVVGGALGGLVAATYQHEVAAESASCAMTWADRVLGELGLEAAWPAMFRVTANCAEAQAYTLIGLPYELWSGLLFAAVLALGLIALLRGSRM